MTIRAKLIISYLVVTLGLCLGFIVVTHYAITEDMTESNLKAAREGVAQIAGKNYELSKLILTDYGELIVELRTDKAISDLALLLRDIPRPFDYNALRSNEMLRAAATQNIYTRDGIAGYVDVLDKQGEAVWHPNKTVEGRNFIEWKTDFPKMWEMVEESFTNPCVKGYYTFLDKETQQSRHKYMVLKHVPDTDFIITATVYIDDYFLPVHKQIKELEEKTVERVDEQIVQTSRRSTARARLIGLIGLSVLTLVGTVMGLFFAHSISDPIANLEKAVEEIGSGDFSARVSEEGPQEIKRLANVFNRLGQQLKEYVDNLRKETEARQVVEREIHIAQQIQQSLIPRVFPPFPKRDEFTLHAYLQPAKEVAGDYYDFFFIDDDSLILIIGDVSGKSVPAAFFMAVTRTLMRVVCMHEKDPAKALSYVNKILLEDNDTCMFVTLFLANYNVRTGVMQYANAGHHAAYKLSLDGQLKAFGCLNDPVLGAIPVETFHAGTEQIGSGDKFVLYTDGVTEANDPEGNMYGDEQFKDFLIKHATLDPKSLCKDVVVTLWDYQVGIPFDDITILVLQRST